MSFKDNLDAVSNFLGRIGVFEVAIFFVLFGAFWVWLDLIVYPDVDLMGPLSSWAESHVRPLLVKEVIDGQG